jgi:hypothetical protein
MNLPALILAVFAALAGFSTPGSAATSHRVMVAAAGVDRLAVAGSFMLPSGAPSPAALRGADGRNLPLQIEANGVARFVIPAQRAGETLVFTPVAGAPAPANITVTRHPSEVGITVGGRPALAYQLDKDKLPRPDIDPRYRRAAYLHPVLSPSGAVVSGDYPANHPHQHGIWTSWSKVLFQGRATNFWETIEQKGNTGFESLERTWSGPVHGGFVARQQLIDLTAPLPPVVALNETWELTTLHVDGAAPAARIFDLVIMQAAATADPVVLPKHLYGGTGFRGRDEWNGRDNLTVLTSEGATTRDTANLTRVRWGYFGGAVEGGGHAGIAILGHPDNLRAPQPIRVHPEMPYVCFAPVQLGDVRIEAGRPYVARYRFVVIDGAPDRARLDAYWNGFAQPADVVVRPE